MDTGQDTGTLRVTIREAVARLGVSEADIRKRIQRGSLEKEMGTDGRVYVCTWACHKICLTLSHRYTVIPWLRTWSRSSEVEELRGRVA